MGLTAQICAMSSLKQGCLLSGKTGERPNFICALGLVNSRPFNSEYVTQEDLTKAARKVGDAKKHESE